MTLKKYWGQGGPGPQAPWIRYWNVRFHSEKNSLATHIFFFYAGGWGLLKTEHSV